MVHVAEYLEWDTTELRPVSNKHTQEVAKMAPLEYYDFFLLLHFAYYLLLFIQ